MRFSNVPSNPFRAKSRKGCNGNVASAAHKHFPVNISRTKVWVAFLLIESLWIRQYYLSYLDLYEHENNFSESPNHPHDVHQYTNNDDQNPYIAHFSNDPIRTREMQGHDENNNPNNIHGEHQQHPSSRSRISMFQESPLSKLDPNKMDVPEPGYPKETHLVDYQTSASEREIEKHDRFLVQGMHYMRTHDFQPLSRVIEAHKARNDNGKKQNPPKICLNIYLCNRRIPYINSLLLSLTSFSTPSNEQDFLQLAQVHLLNTEKRPERLHFKYMRETLSQLPFVHKVHNITYRDEIYENIHDRDLIFREMFISDEISGLKICVESGLEYCIMMEEDAVVPVDFMTLLKEQVIQPLEEGGVLFISISPK